MTKTFITTALAAIAVLAAVPAAFAATPSDNVTFKVSTAGLNLRSPQDAQSMMRRIEAAASAVCGGVPYAGNLDAAHDYKVCVSYNAGQAVRQLASPEVVDISTVTTTQTASNDR